MSPELVEAVTDTVMNAFTNGYMPTRRWLVERIREKYPSLTHPRLDLWVGKMLNRLVDRRVLRRIKGALYAPGEQYCKPV